MPSIIQTIEIPKRARALDTSTGWQAVGAELITNGTMEADSNWADYNSVSSNTRSSTQEYTGTYSRKFTPNGTSQGIQSDDFTTVTGKTYKVSFWVYPDDGTIVRWVVRKGDDSGFQSDTSVTGLNENAWNYVTGTYIESVGGSGAHLVIHSNTQTSGDFYIDDVSIKEIRNFPNNNHGQIYSGRGLEFDGIGDRISLTNAYNIIDFSAETTQANRAWTVVCWVNYYANDEANHMGVMHGGGGVKSVNYIGLRGAGAYVNRLTIYDPGGGPAFRVGNTALEANVWYRAVWVFDGDTTVSFYLNGVADGTGEIDNTGINAGGENWVDLAFQHIGNSGDRPWNGALSDFQIWTGAWTADDVTYDYLNPESLVLNRGGTSFTNSNLKIWYPMQDGHRGQQSYVLDASNTGLGDELIVNGDFSDSLTGWTVGSDSAGTHEVTSVSGGARFLAGASGTVMTFMNSAALVVGVTYRLVVVISNYNGSNGIKIQSGSIITVATFTSNGTHEYYLTPTGSGTLISFYRTGSDVDLVIESVSLKPVNDKHNATTVFYGDEEAVNGHFETFPDLHASNNDTFTDESVDVSQNATMVTEESVASSGSKSGKVTLNDTSGYITYNKTDYIVGRTYYSRVSMRAGGSQTITAFQMFAAESIRGEDGTDGTALSSITEGFQTASVTFVATATTMFINMKFTGTNGHYSFIDDFTIKEVGTDSIAQIIFDLEIKND